MKAEGEHKIKMTNTKSNITHGKNQKRLLMKINMYILSKKKKTEIELHVYSDRD